MPRPCHGLHHLLHLPKSEVEIPTGRKSEPYARPRDASGYRRNESPQCGDLHEMAAEEDHVVDSLVSLLNQERILAPEKRLVYSR